MSEHTHEPWTVSVEEEEGEWHNITINEIGRCLHDSEWADSKDFDRDLANARRIVACVNACAGVPTEALESAVECADHGVMPTLAAQYLAERDEAIIVLKSLIAEYNRVNSYDDLNLLQIIYNAQDVIRKVTP